MSKLNWKPIDRVRASQATVNMRVREMLDPEWTWAVYPDVSQTYFCISGGTLVFGFRYRPYNDATGKCAGAWKYEFWSANITKLGGIPT